MIAGVVIQKDYKYELNAKKRLYTSIGIK